ncbi:DUF4082 domain-containing protein [Ornithinimicrobium kibberense]
MFRLGWYQGNGARHLADVTPTGFPRQPEPLRDETTGLVDCGNWSVCATWQVPADAVSGVYYALLSPSDGSRSSHIFFVVRRPGPSDILVQTSEMTMHAYNRFGGNSFYYGQPAGRAYKVSYNRPLQNDEAESNFLNAEIPLVRWLERNGYDVSYCGGIDVHRDAGVLQGRKVYISSGHDEYVSGPQRAHVEAARDAGTHLIFMTGNEYFWRVRFEPSIDGSATTDRTMVCYKETLDDAKTDPLPEWTGTWRDPRFSPPSNGGRPENELTGQLFRAILPIASPDYRITVPAEFARHRFWRDTAVAELQPGQTRDLAPNTLGYEFDVDADNGFRPPGLIRLSTTEAEVPALLMDYGKTYVRGTCTHHLTMYRAASGALVWGTGTVQWSYGLDDYHISDVDTPTDPVMQQATMNVLADMGVLPTTRQSGLVMPVASADTLAPTTTIVTPAPGSQVPIGTPLVLTGTAVDAGGGIVAAVEASVDGGATWHQATGKESWTYLATPTETGDFTVQVRAVDDSCNIGAAATLTLTAVPRGYPCTIFAEGTVPATEAVDDPGAIEVGVRFEPQIDGFVTGLRFYKGAGNTGEHLGRLWTAGGTQLASAPFTAESRAGWQTVSIPAVAVSAGTTYVASVFMPAGHYPADAGFFQSAYELAPLRAPASGEAGLGNGVYRYGTAGFPTQTFGATNYWVDVLFDTDNHLAPTVVDHSPASNLQSVAPTTTVSARFSEAVLPESVELTLQGPDGAARAAALTYDPATRTATLAPESALEPLTAYTATVAAATDEVGNPLEPFSWGFTTIGPPGTTPTSLWDTAAGPVSFEDDRSPVELGLRFQVTLAGAVTALRFYKAPGSSGSHVGHLWDEDGSLLGTAVYASETAVGWQQAPLSAPVDLFPGRTYTVSYHLPNGSYGFTSAAFAASGHRRGPLQAPANDTVGGNGVYAYGSGGLPTNAHRSTNYWADVVFEVAPDVGPPEVVDVEPASGLLAVALDTTVRAQFDEPVDEASISFRLRTADGVEVASTIAYDPGSATATLTPRDRLDRQAGYTATVTATDTAGNPMAQPHTWSFTTVAADGSSPTTLWDTSFRPAVEAEGDSSPVELGVRFQTSRPGTITGLRFFRGPGNDGPHIGHLWTADGTLLATLSFTGETRRGWQQALFADPVPVAADTAYVASYHAPVGRYAATSGGLAAGRTNGPLVAVAGGSDTPNGVFAYGPGGFPSSSWGSGNYWVDVIFADSVAPSVVQRSPDPGAVVAPDVVVSAVFDEPVDPATVALSLRDGGGGKVAGTTTYDPETWRVALAPDGPLAPGATYTASVSGATDPQGNVMDAAVSWNFTVADTGFSSLWSLADAPAVTLSGDPGAVTLGLRFRPVVAGHVHGVRFYKGGPANAGPHTVTLWRDDGTEVATAVLGAESARGWQTGMFTAPVPVVAGTLYVVSYHAPHGNYSVTGGYFTDDARANAEVEAPRSADVGGNGLYRYGTSAAFPQSSWNGSNYWVDVLFRTG